MGILPENKNNTIKTFGDHLSAKKESRSYTEGTNSEAITESEE